MGREGRNNAVEIARQEKNRWKKRALRAEATLAKLHDVQRLARVLVEADGENVVDPLPYDEMETWRQESYEALARAVRDAILDESPTDVATALTGASDMERIGPDFATSPTAAHSSSVSITSPEVMTSDAVSGESPTERETPADEPIAKRLTHTYMGDCPDDVNGWESRDPECPACRALVEMVPDDRA